VDSKCTDVCFTLNVSRNGELLSVKAIRTKVGEDPTKLVEIFLVLHDFVLVGFLEIRRLAIILVEDGFESFCVGGSFRVRTRSEDMAMIVHDSNNGREPDRNDAEITRFPERILDVKPAHDFVRGGQTSIAQRAPVHDASCRHDIDPVLESINLGGQTTFLEVVLGLDLDTCGLVGIDRAQGFGDGGTKG